MIALDTNVIVRFLVRDDPAQSHTARARLKHAEATGERLFISIPVVLETIWVLQSAYERSDAEIAEALEALCRLPMIEFESQQIVHRLLMTGCPDAVDLDDRLIALVGESHGCEYGLTFDKRAARLPFYRLLKAS